METVLSSKLVKIRKPHNCWGCAKNYETGTKMKSVAVKIGYGIETIYWCSTCQEYMQEHFESGDDCEYGGIFANDTEEWERIERGVENE